MNPKTTIAKTINLYCDELAIAGQSPRTIEGTRLKLNRFARFAKSKRIATVGRISRSLLLEYRHDLHLDRSKRNGEPLLAATQAQHLTILRMFLVWLHRQKAISEDYSECLPLPRLPKRRIVSILTERELTLLFQQPNVLTRIGLRDRAILETLFSTAIRATELANLDVNDLDPTRKIVHVRRGKGAKDRLTPIGSRAVQWIEAYQKQVRPQHLRNTDEQCLFLGQTGRRLGRTRLAQIVRSHMVKAKIAKAGACHLLRHTAASLMLENGADLRSLQLYLGHERLDTTQIYTHMTLGRLSEVHQKTHPTGDYRSEPSEAWQRPARELPPAA